MVRRWLRLFDTRPPKNRKFGYSSIEWMVRTMAATSKSRANWINYYYVVCVLCCPKLFRPLSSFEKLVESVGASTPIVFLIRLMELVSITLHGDQFICDASVSVKTEIKSDEQHPQQWNQKTQIRNRYNWWQWDSTHQMLRGLFICSDINGNIISDLNVCQCFCSHIFYLTSARMENRCTPVRYG